MNVELQLAHAAPEAGSPLTVRALLRITGQAPEGVEHTPMHLALVLDRSGSMSGEKLARAREAAALVIRRMWPEDRVSVVAYDNEVWTLLDAASGDRHADGVTAVEQLQAGGTTNLSGGWLRARDLVEAALVPAGVNRILLMTDGLANQGITDAPSLTGLCRAATEAGITTTTIGFGEGFNEDLLRAMADAGGGATYYIERPDQAPGIFEEEIEGLLSLAAQNVGVEVKAGDGAKLVAVRHTYPSRTEDGVMRLEVGDLYAREPRLVLMEFLVDAEAAAAGAEVALGSITVRGHVLDGQGGVERKTVALPVRFQLGEGPRVDAEVERTALLLAAARARNEALELNRQGRRDEAGNVLHDVAARLESAGDETSVEEARELRSWARLALQDLGAADAKYLKQRAHDVHRSRMEARKRYRRD